MAVGWVGWRGGSPVGKGPEVGDCDAEGGGLAPQCSDASLLPTQRGGPGLRRIERVRERERLGGRTGCERWHLSARLPVAERRSAATL